MALRERALSEHAVELPEPWNSAALTVVLPTYNEAANLPVVVAELMSLPLTGLRILIADDNSPDGTGDIADKLAAAVRRGQGHRPAPAGEAGSRPGLRRRHDAGDQGGRRVRGADGQ